MNPNDIQVGGSHYKAQLQHWDYAVAALFNRYLEGNLTKYVLRHRKKNGLQDLHKARHYLAKLIVEYRAARVAPMPLRRPWGLMDAFLQSNGVSGREEYILRFAATWQEHADLLSILEALDQLIDYATNQERIAQARKAGATIAGEPGPGYVNQD